MWYYNSENVIVCLLLYEKTNNFFFLFHEKLGNLGLMGIAKVRTTSFGRLMICTVVFVVFK